MFYFPLDESLKNIDTAPTTAMETFHESLSLNSLENIPKKDNLELLDLYSGCGGMSTGLCLGAKYSSVGLITVVCLMLSFFFLISRQLKLFLFSNTFSFIQF